MDIEAQDYILSMCWGYAKEDKLATILQGWEIYFQRIKPDNELIEYKSIMRMRIQSGSAISLIAPNIEEIFPEDH
jgi:hypothetical protein